MIAVTVKIPGEDDRVVIVQNADDDMHARLAAYFYLYNLLGIYDPPTAEELIKVTSTWKSSGPVNAQIYRNHFKDNS